MCGSLIHCFLVYTLHHNYLGPLKLKLTLVNDLAEVGTMSRYTVSALQWMTLMILVETSVKIACTKLKRSFSFALWWMWHSRLM